MNPYLDYAILILNYNGESLLKHCLQMNLQAMQSSSYRGEIIVVDNDSQDESKAIVSSFEEVKLYPCDKNEVLYSYNRAVKESTQAQYIILLNNDEWLSPNSIDILIDCLRQSPNHFLAVPKNVDPGVMSFQAGLFEAEFKMGHLLLRNLDQDSNQPQKMSLGCLGAYRRSLFLKLGGFEKLLLPFYWEDADLSYRASKAGYDCFYCSEAMTEHESQATISKFNREWVHFINRRNKLLFFYLNVSSLRLWFGHFWAYPMFCLREFLRGNSDYLMGLLWLIVHFKDVLRARNERIHHFVRKDEDLVELPEWSW